MATKPDGISWEEFAEGVLRANKAMSRAIDLSEQQFEKITEHVKALQGTQRNLQAQLDAEKASKLALAKEIGNAGKADREEVMRLRALCEENGVNPNG